ncbi:MAG TPA: hypothetical protein VF131_11660 [Blastocatellia bacterium]|nr:hypothetical protein [Blastocatellia bacterium]
MSIQQSLENNGRTIDTVRIRRYLVNGKESTKNELAAQPFIVAGTDLPDEGTAYGFATEESLCRWAAALRHADRFARSIGTTKLGQQLEGTATGERAVRRIEASVKKLTADLEELSKETGLAIGTPEFLVEASIHRSAIEPPLFDPTLLFDKVTDPGFPPVFGGVFFPVAAAIPTFFGFNDKASGALVLGLCTLFDKTFFRGQRAFLFATTPIRFVLSDIAYDNRAASGIAT